MFLIVPIQYIKSNIWFYFILLSCLIKMYKQQYSDQYKNFGFIELKNKVEFVAQCVVFMKTLSNASMKPSLPQRYLQTNHADKKDRDLNHFKRLGENAKKRLDKTGKQYQQLVGIVQPPMKLHFCGEEQKASHNS